MDAHRLSSRQRLAFLVLVLTVVGCSSASRQDMSRDVLQRDPSFQAVLNQRDAIEHQVDNLREQLVAAQTAAEQQVRAVQQEFRQTRGRLQGQIRELVKQLEPEREKLQLDMATSKHQIRTQEAAVQGLQRTIADLQHTLNRSTARPSAAPPAPSADGTVPPTGGPERSTMGAADRAAVTTQLADTQHQLQQAEQDLAAHRAHLKILEYKLRLLRIE